MKLKNLLYPSILAAALVALGIGFVLTQSAPMGEQSKLAYKGTDGKNLWCVSNYIEQEPTEYLEDGRPRKDKRLDDKVDWIRKEQVEADTKAEAETKATRSGIFEPSDKNELRKALDDNNKEFFTTHFNTGATSPGPCLGGGSTSESAGTWVNDGINEDCFGITSTSSGSCEMKEESIEIIGKGSISLPAEGKIVLESHLVTKEENYWPSSVSDRINDHYRVTDAAIGKTFNHTTKWTPAEGGGKIGQGSASRPPASVEPWVMNMYWKNKPAEGTKVIITNPSTGESVVAAAGYETGPSTEYLLGAQEEVMQAIGAQTGSMVKVGFAKDQSLPYGPIDCSSNNSASLTASTSGSSGTTTIVIDPGHGSSANTRKYEDKTMMEIGTRLSQKLKSNGYNTVMTHSSVGQTIGGATNENDDNIARASIANNAKPAVSIRLHSDARSDDTYWVMFPDRKGQDRTNFTGPLSNIVIPESKKFAQVLHSTLSANGYKGVLKGEGSYTSSGKGTLLIMSAHSKHPVVTLEIYGHNNATLRSKYSQESQQNKLAQAITEAVKKYAPISTRSSTTNSNLGTPASSATSSSPLPDAPAHCPDEPLPAGPSTGEDYQLQIAQAFEASLPSTAEDVGTGESTDLANLGIAPGNADAIVAVARGEVGYQGELCPNGKRDRTKYDGCAQWCAYFATWVYRQAGFNIPSIGGSRATLDWFKRNGHYVYSDISQSEPGDIIVWKRKGNSGHIGIISKNDRSAQKIKVIEGNTSNDTVKENTYSYQSARNLQLGLYGLGRWRD